ncbi:exodeoxyribonuclease III [Flavobacterium branchiophilum]|uniref:Exodeoxyribonuclease III n=2 Tax=Flavobacterium branchiophilum TaxID=55197 RepID=G2Z097_FLABF|nr:exodeoxyribonuclease III [Flavobacterium branchiophilum]OXA73801.1 exodeoxyribonuclease III [Flavobacterium branchiophilum] [Flavobacterium branchiophilum NBRC 15030 = ATCC 35035]PDS23830.1 exodeoxyribonuclease III [Flavobacterium branchiophilum]TQM40092.1 exodeoxyribonuclease-3 [Flavobacterium branchiophilum]CCB70733.1 Exodeoxyribonuclease III [Flavobacterium branchiophilum FL-15]GEM55913.1 exodeoxyribonuclease III [Flavobacterium branchiophilum NBRC 15030 = ATCC 35035]
MKIISYNVNGIRAAINKGFITWLQQANPDVICLQEIKATTDQIPQAEITLAGYPYQYYFPAQKKGYSGVAILSKTAPKNVVFGTGIAHMDFEGRNIRADFEGISIMSLYLPSGTNDDRLEYKFQYMAEFKSYIDQLKTQVPNLLICGDYNICHQAIDIHDPIRNKNVSGFLPEERAWLDHFINSGFIDTFRHFNQQPHQYSWWSYRAGARGNNKGWRIDYHLATQNLQQNLKRAVILPEAMHSDHCPIVVEIDV